MDTSLSRLLNRLRHSYPNGIPKSLIGENRLCTTQTLEPDYSSVLALFVGENFSNEDRELVTRAITKGLKWNEYSVMIRDIKDLAENFESIKLRPDIAVVQCGETPSWCQTVIQSFAQPQMIFSTVHPRDARENQSQKRLFWNTVQQVALMVKRSG
jgi:hypothetical protein